MSSSIPWTKIFFQSACPCGSGEIAYKCCWRGGGRWEKTPVGTIAVSKTSTKNAGCYLSPLGNCGTKITREHFISRNILERMTQSKLKFENAGHFFGGKQSVEISIDAFSAKVLCDNHNSALSALDTSAGLALTTIDALGMDIERVATGEPFRSFYISSGIDLERWMIKVYCGLVAAGKIRGQSGDVVGLESLSRNLLDSLIGTASLPQPLGLYMHTFVGQQRRSRGLSFGTIKLTDGSDGVGGLILSLGPINVVLVTSPLYGEAFSDPNWYRHQPLAWNVRQYGSRIAYLFTY